MQTSVFTKSKQQTMLNTDGTRCLIRERPASSVSSKKFVAGFKPNAKIQLWSIYVECFFFKWSINLAEVSAKEREASILTNSYVKFLPVIKVLWLNTNSNEQYNGYKTKSFKIIEPIWFMYFLKVRSLKTVTPLPKLFWSLKQFSSETIAKWLT